MNDLNNYFGLKIMPWRPPLDVLDEKIRPAIAGLRARMHREITEFHVYRGVDGTVYAELRCTAVKKVRAQPLTHERVVARFTSDWGILLIRSDSFDELFKPRLTPPVDAHEVLYESARKWWLNKRPIGWNLRQHLKNPRVNCTSSAEDTLAYAVARMEFAGYYKRVSNRFT